MLAKVIGAKTGRATGPICPLSNSKLASVSRASSGKTEESEPTLDRRSALLVSLGVLLGSAESAQAATSDAYYRELKANAKGLESTDLLSRYSSLKDGGGKKGGSRGASSRSVSKNVAKNAEALGLRGSKVPTAKASKPGPKASKATSRAVSKTSTASSASAASFNPVEVGLGLLALAGVGAIGARGSSKSSSSKGSSSPLRKAPVNKASPPPPKKKATPPPPKKATPPPPPPKKKTAPVGTQKLRPGTRSVQAAKTKRVGTVAKGAAPAEKQGGSGGAGAIVGVVALLGAAVVLSGGSQKHGNPSAAPKTPVLVESKAKATKASVTPAAAPAVKADKVDKTQALIVKVEEKKPETATEAVAPAIAPTSKLPPTTGNSPAVLIGGSLLALVAAAAVGGPAQGGESSSSSPSSAAGESSAADDASSRAREARQWIDAWKAKQR